MPGRGLLANPERDIAEVRTAEVRTAEVRTAEVRTAEGKPHLFVAIDRVTKFAFVQPHEKATRRVAGDLPHGLR